MPRTNKIIFKCGNFGLLYMGVCLPSPNPSRRRRLGFGVASVIRPLAKLNIEFKITDTGYKVKAQSEAFSAVAVPIRNDFKAFDTSDNMFIENTVA